jgi:hypothetical protein
MPSLADARKGIQLKGNPVTSRMRGPKITMPKFQVGYPLLAPTMRPKNSGKAMLPPAIVLETNSLYDLLLRCEITISIEQR